MAVHSGSATDQRQGVSFNQIPVGRPKKGKKYQSIRQVVESPEMAGGERVSPVERPKKGKKYQSIRQVVESQEKAAGKTAGGERVSPVDVNAIITDVWNLRKRRRLR
jgi:catalase